MLDGLWVFRELNWKGVEDEYLEELYLTKHLPMSEISRLTGLTRQRVYQRIKKRGVELRRVAPYRVSCSGCGTIFEKLRCLVKKSTKNYCRATCYYESIHQPKYVQWRQGQRIARQVVSKYFTLKKGMVVHHRNEDNRDNRPENLAVFKTQADHMRYHRIGTWNPMWEYKARSNKMVSEA